MRSYLLLVPAVILGAALWIRHDYRAWRALGEGGLPANLRGWITATRFRLRKAPTRTTEVYDALVGGPEDVQLLHGLPSRNGPRPQFAPWPVPHRQTDQFVGTQMRASIDALFERTVAERPNDLGFELSFYEKRNRAVTARHPGRGPAVAQLAHGEIAHVHPSDGSIHLVLSPSDARSTIRAGWGERHPMAGVLDELPVGYLFIYPPRDEHEAEVIAAILQASVGYMLGGA